MFRVNYGQGQVSQTFNARKEAQRYLDSHTDSGFMFLQFRDNGEWFHIKYL